MISHKGVVIEAPAIAFIGDGQFTPVDVERVGFRAEGHLVHIAVGPQFAKAPVPLAMRQAAHATQRRQRVYPLVHCRMGIGLADQDKVALLCKGHFTEGLMAVEIIAQ